MDVEPLTGLGLKDAVTPLGWPLIARLTDPVDPVLLTVIVDVRVPPDLLDALRLDGLALKLKSGAGVLVGPGVLVGNGVLVGGAGVLVGPGVGVGPALQFGNEKVPMRVSPAKAAGGRVILRREPERATVNRIHS